MNIPRVRNDSPFLSLKEPILKWQLENNKKTCLVMQPKLISQFRQNYVLLNHFLTDKNMEKFLHPPRWLFELNSYLYFRGFANYYYLWHWPIAVKFWEVVSPSFDIKFNLGLSIGSFKNEEVSKARKCQRMTGSQWVTVTDGVRENFINPLATNVPII